MAQEAAEDPPPPRLNRRNPITGEISNLVRHHKNIELPVNSHSLLGPPGGVAGDALGMGDILEQRKKMYSEMRE